MEDWEPPIERRRARSGEHGWLIWLAVLVVLGVIGALLWSRRGEIQTLVEKIEVTDAGAEVAAAEPDAGAAAALPPEEGDELLRSLAARGSKSPELSGWLAAPNILQRVAAASRLIADGKSPRPVLTFIEIEDDFAVEERGNRVFISPRAYARYDGLVRAFTSMDPGYAARSYVDLRRHFDAAFAQVARPGERFDDVLAAAIQRLISVKVPEGQVELVPVGAIYTFKDPELEGLTAAEKHVLRMGPENAAALQKWLERFAQTAGLSI